MRVQTFFLNRGAVICEIGAVYSQMVSSVEFFLFFYFFWIILVDS